jgi:hypothetical protein
MGVTKRSRGYGRWACAQLSTHLDKEEKERKAMPKTKKKGGAKTISNATRPAGAAIVQAAPCKIAATADAGVFQVKASDMAVKIQLFDAPGTIATKCSFNKVSVYPEGSSTPVPGQPSGVTNTDFILTLPPGGTYDVVMALNALPDCAAAYIFEACATAVCLDLMAPQVQPSGYFKIKVV